MWNKKAINFIVVMFAFLAIVFTVVPTMMGASFMVLPMLGYLLITAVIVVVFLYFFGKALAPKDIPNGLPATASVISCRQGNLKLTSGVSENYQLIIEINATNPQGETWQATMKEMINITQISVFQPGVSFAVKYDPNDRKRVVFDRSAGAQQQNTGHSYNIPGGVVNTAMALNAIQQQPKDITLRLQASSALLTSLTATGISGTAEVLSRYTLLENYMQGVDAICVRFRVNETGIEEEQAMITPKTSLHKSEVGDTVFVRYDPKNHQRVTISGLEQPNSAQAL